MPLTIEGSRLEDALTTGGSKQYDFLATSTGRFCAERWRHVVVWSDARSVCRVGLAGGAGLSLPDQHISVAEKTIRGDLGLSEEQMGLILGPAFFWTYALAQIPSSRLGERLGARRSLPLFA